MWRLRLNDKPPDARQEEGLSRRDFLRLTAGGAAASLLVGCGLSSRGRRPELLVWSCGGNYDFLLEFNHRFEQLADCRITYSSAPVEHLISVLASRPRGVDVLVGRSGPGWSDLQQRGRLAGKPAVFALDPYVIIVSPGNPAGIRGLADLKRPEVKTVYAPTSSGPSGKVVQFILEAADEVVEPGIWDGYLQNAIEAHDCGWKVFPPIIEGRAHASVTRLSMTTVPEIRGKVDIIPIPVEVMAAMKEGHGAIPQRCALLADGKSPDLAARYIQDLRGELGSNLCTKHGYVHRLSPQAKSHQPLFQMRATKRPGPAPSPGRSTDQ
ncbi:MAG: substrate-binding domain-containing protein [Armatimonadota bacterium]|nr:MAG: substrate-binding domain-containing protein [Armatimonadota bacterium]